MGFCQLRGRKELRSSLDKGEQAAIRLHIAVVGQAWSQLASQLLQSATVLAQLRGPLRGSSKGQNTSTCCQSLSCDMQDVVDTELGAQHPLNWHWIGLCCNYMYNPIINSFLPTIYLIFNEVGCLNDTSLNQQLKA